MEKQPWNRTLVTQVFLCFALYIALNLGEHKKYVYNKNKIYGARPLGLCFISVRGGSFRSLNQQTRLLKQMEKVTKNSDAKFVVNISELGEEDPFMQNGTRHFSSLKIPWYNTRTMKEHEVGNFIEQIKLPYGKILDIIGIDTSQLQGSMLMGPESGVGGSQLLWLTRTLENTSSNWRIVFGYHPLVLWNESQQKMEAKQVFKSIHNLFTRFGVNAYISGCGYIQPIQLGSVAYIGIPSPVEEEPYLDSDNGRGVSWELVDGFLLHRVSSLEIVTYHINVAGEPIHRTSLKQRGKEPM